MQNAYGYSAEQRAKIGQFCNVRPEAVINGRDAKSIYHVPLMYHEEGLDMEICRHFDLPLNEPDLSIWRDIGDTILNPEGEVNIAIVGKYVSLLDSYKSLAEALVHGGLSNKVKVNLNWVDSEDVEQSDNISHILGDVMQFLSLVDLESGAQKEK